MIVFYKFAEKNFVGFMLSCRKPVLLLAVLAVCGGALAQKRGMSNPQAVLIEKGTFSAGLSFGFDSWDASGDDGYNLLGFFEGLDGYARKIDVSAQSAWFVGDNLSVGLRFGYDDTRLSVDSTKFSSLEIPDRNIIYQAFNGALTCRGYLPLFDGHIIAMFCEGRLSGSVGYSKSYRETGNGKEGVYSDIWTASAGLYPGICVFATQNVAFEVSLPLLEGGVRWQKQDGTDANGTLSRTFFNFKPKLIGLRMGLIYHF